MKNYQTFAFVALTIWGLAFCRLAAAQNRLADYTFGGSGQEICSGIIPASDGGFIVGGCTVSGISGEVTIAPRAPGTAPDYDYWLFKMDTQGNKLWEKRYGGSGDDRLIKVLPSRDGGYLLCGWSNSPVGFDITGPAPGSQNYWVVKTDAQGNKLWDKRYGSAASEMLMTAIATTDGGYLLTGNTGGPLSGPSGDRSMPTRGPIDIWTIKIDASGNKQWDNLLSGLIGNYVYGAANLPGGGFALLAFPFGPVSGDVTGPGNGDQDLWLVKLDAAGNKIWDRLYGGSGYDAGNSLLATSDGGLLIGGHTRSPISGDVGQAGGGPWLLKLDAQGIKQWDRVYTDTITTIGIVDMKELPDGSYALGGQIWNNLANPNQLSPSDFGLMKVSSTGVPIWKQAVGGSDYELFNSMVALPSGDLLAVGTSSSNISRDKTSNSRGGADIWAVKMSGSIALRTTPKLSGVEVSLYPNPANSPLAFLNIHGLQEQTPVQVEVLNMLGQSVSTAPATVLRGVVKQELNLTSLPPGMYLVRVRAKEGVITRSLLKK